ncbi:hypothetical protein EV207_15611 [Scopulibacillus darangshiensis]|uniref:Uncharacterized protein n=1 Tax=Scopulibacillus darangshiensis TaxID=442528 RepID=A0A4R2NFS4_9BACL|nr:hypothetical protein [Scopulibacillus darangshiensis]TCP19975.1 hypothetical protein EV207_15611 [Scopulibacillus darangshiensis]
MSILAEIKPLPVEDMSKDDVLFRELEIKMQQLGHLTPFREELNWENDIASYELGTESLFERLKKTAAKNDGVPLFYAKLFKKTVYQHLILHPNNQGFYLPFRFDEPFTLEVKGEKLWIGSSIRLEEELKWLEMTMRNETDEELIELWKTLKQICNESNTKMTPVTFRTT